MVVWPCNHFWFDRMVYKFGAKKQFNCSLIGGKFRPSDPKVLVKNLTNIDRILRLSNKKLRLFVTSSGGPVVVAGRVYCSGMNFPRPYLRRYLIITRATTLVVAVFFCPRKGKEFIFDEGRSPNNMQTFWWTFHWWPVIDFKSFGFLRRS